MRRVIALVALVFLVAGSGAAFAQATPEGASGTTIVIKHDAKLGDIFTDSSGRTLYVFSNDTEPGKSTCTDQCVQNWPVFSATEPLTLPAGVSGTLTTITRADGTMQVAYNGMPLYYFAGDKAAGDTNGQGVGNKWWVVTPGMMSSAPPMASPMAATPAA